MAETPQTDRRKTRFFSFRADDEEAEAFLAFCKARNLTSGEALRRMMRAAGDMGPTFDGEGRAEVVELTRQVRAIGVNLNQAVHHMNAGNAFPGENVQAWLIEAHGIMRALDGLFSSLTQRARRRAETALEKGAG
ncbi:MAG: plasmid mobilization relaxosome protein MobC [Methylocystis sp.]